MDISVVVNESSWLPGFYENRGHVQPMDEVRVIDNYSVGVQGFQIHTENRNQCLTITSQNYP